MDGGHSLYDQQLLGNLSLPFTLPGHYHVRPLRSDDYHRGHLELLSQLTSVGEVDETKYLEQFKRMQSNADYFVTVIEDTRTNKLVASASLFLEYKFIHNCAVRGRIEDVVVDSACRGEKLGQALVETLKQLSVAKKCYKLTLDCNDQMVPYYQRLGFVAEYGRANSLTIRF